MFSYNSYPPQFAERSHGRHGHHAYGGPRGPHPDEFAAFGYADFPEPPMKGFKGGKPFGRHGGGYGRFGHGGPHAFGGPQGPPQGPYGPGPHAFGFGGPRGFHHHHRGPPPPPPGAEYGFFGFGGPRGFGRHGPPPFEFGTRSFACHGPPPAPFNNESGSSSEDNEKSCENGFTEPCSKDGSEPFGFGFGHGRRGGRRHNRGFPGSGFEMFGARRHGHRHRGGFPAEEGEMRSSRFGGRHHRRDFPGEDGEMRSFGFGGHHHGGRRGFGRFGRSMEDSDEDFTFMHKKHRGPARVESRVLESQETFQVQILRHGSSKGFKHYEITYETNDGEVILSIDSQFDDVSKTFKFKEDAVVMDEVSWDVIDRCLVVSIPKVESEQSKESEDAGDVDMDNATLIEKPKGKKSKKSKKSKSKKVSSDEKVPSRPSSTETWSSISTPSASEDEAETGNKVQIKAASKPSRDDEPFRFRLPDLNNNLASNGAESESESETTESSSSDKE